MTRACFTLATIALFGALTSACATRTEVIIAVQSDIAGLDRVLITVTGPTGTMQTSTATFGTGPPELARTLGVTYSSGPLGPFLVTVSGFRASTQVISRTAVFEFVRNETRILRMNLLASCQGVTCPAMQTCAEAGCRAELIAPAELIPYNGSIPTHDTGVSFTDSGAGPIDSGGGNDAAMPMPDTGPITCGGTVCMLPHVSTTTCAGGRCTVGTCDPGFLNCDGRNSTGCEADGNTDRNNCGTCGMQCNGGTAICCRGTCAAACP